MNVIKRLSKLSTIGIVGIVLVAIVSFFGCGYTFVNVKKQLPPDLKKVYIPSFNNPTDEPRLGVIMTNALIGQFMKSGALTPVKEKEADAQLIGTIESVDYYNTIYDEEDRAVLVTVSVRVGAKLIKDGTVVWEVSGISYTEDYNIETGAVVFDSFKEVALQDLSEKLAVEIHDRLVFGY